MRRRFEISGQRILEVLLERSGATWSELQEWLGVANAPGAVGMDLYNHLWALCDAGLICVDGVERDNTADVIRYWLHDALNERRKIRASDTWLKIRGALRGNHSAHFSPPYSVLVTPFFGTPRDPEKQTDVFVLMPFAHERRAIYEDHIVRPIEGAHLSVARADDYLTTHPIMSDVWAGICGCGVVVADCTGRNPNVFYEIGVAHAIGKKVVLITESPDDVPADLRHVRYIPYEFTPRGMKAFEEQLVATVRSSLGVY